MNMHEKVKNEIQNLKKEVIKITNQIEFFRKERDEEDVSIGTELQDKLQMITEKIDVLRTNLLRYKGSSSIEDVSLGNGVQICKKSNCKEITIVLPEDADSPNGFISLESPLGNALLGKKIGDKVDFPTPSGSQKFDIKKIF
jgi:transcription elongation factor GreA